MFREMRRKKQLLSQSENLRILNNSTNGVLAVLGDDGYPYCIPLSYVYFNNKIYFHSAKCGHKLDAIINSPKASFCIVEKDEIVPEEYTTYFRSIVAFGTVRIIEEEREIIDALNKLAAKYSPLQEQARKNEIEQQLKHLCMIELSIEHLTGKEAIELVRKRAEKPHL